MKLMDRSRLVVPALIIVFVSTCMFHGKVDAQAENKQIPRLETIECPFAIPANARIECHALIVPENRSNPESRTIRIPVAIIKSHGENPAPDPVLFPSAGGPGASSFRPIRALTHSPFLETRDLIVTEQRGNAFAEPSLSCPEFDAVMFDTFTTSSGSNEEMKLMQQSAARCYNGFVDQGADLNGYNTHETVSDLEDLRTLLGISQWNVTATSYATRIALEMARRYPQSIRSLLLDSVLSPSDNHVEIRVPTAAQALDLVFANCARDKECNSAYPDLREHFSAMQKNLNANPAIIVAKHPQSGKPVTLHLTGEDILQAIFNLLYNRETIALVPFFIEELYKGNQTVLEPIAEMGFAFLFEFNHGMSMSFNCSEQVPFNSLERQKSLAKQYPGFESFYPMGEQPELCDVWRVQSVDATEHTPVSSDIPALVWAGEYDPTTSPQEPKEAAQHLTNAHFYMVSGVGHSVADQLDCADKMNIAFVNDPTKSPDDSCMSEAHPVNFITTHDDVFPTPAIYHLNRDVLATPNYFQLVILGILLLSFVAQLGVSGAFVLRSRGQTRSRSDYLLPVLALVISILNLIFIASLAGTVLNANQLMLGFGLPKSFTPFFLLPWLALVLTVILMVQVFRGWHKENNSVYYSVFSVTSSAFLIWLSIHGFFIL